MIHHNIPPEEFLEFVHDIDLSFMKEDKIMRNELEKLNMDKLYLQMEALHMLKIFYRI